MKAKDLKDKKRYIIFKGPKHLIGMRYDVDYEGKLYHVREDDTNMETGIVYNDVLRCEFAEIVEEV